MLRVNRTFLFVYDLLITLAFLMRYIVVGPVLFNTVWCYFVALAITVVGLVVLNYINFSHPTPLEIVAYHVNLIMRHPLGQQSNTAYDEQNKRYLSDRFIGSENYQFFYYEDCCAKTDQYRQMKIKLALGHQTYYKTSIIIKTMDDQYIRFNMVKPTDYSMLAFLYEWQLDGIEYSDRETFEEMIRGRE